MWVIMKNMVKYLSMILISLSLVGCGIDNANPIIDIGESTKFSEEEIDKAVDCLKEIFDF